MSIVYYKFKSARDYDTATFDGIGISVFDLKREIMLSKKLGKGTDFDLAVSHAQTGEVYDDDMFIIPRNTQILVSRNPPAGKQGTAQRYVSGPMPIQSGGSRAVISQPGDSSSLYPTHTGKSSTLINVETQQRGQTNDLETNGTENMTEEERIQAMFKQSEDYWHSQEKILATQRPVIRPRAPGPPKSITAANKSSYYEEMPARPPPPGYICYRCGQRGHYINQCPTIGDAEFDNKPRLRRTTGIPKMFLKTVEQNPDSLSSGLMVTQTGEFVVAKPNEQAWNKLTKTSRNYLGFGDISDKVSAPDHLKCSLCSKLFNDPVQIPCCQKIFCDECIRSSLLENPDPTLRFKCPNCKSDQFPDNLISNKDISSLVDQFVRSYFETNTTTQQEPQTEAVKEPIKEREKVMPFKIVSGSNHLGAQPVVTAPPHQMPPSQTSVVPAVPSSTAPVAQKPVVKVVANNPAPKPPVFKIIKEASASPRELESGEIKNSSTIPFTAAQPPIPSDPTQAWNNGANIPPYGMMPQMMMGPGQYMQMNPMMMMPQMMGYPGMPYGMQMPMNQQREHHSKKRTHERNEEYDQRKSRK